MITDKRCTFAKALLALALVCIVILSSLSFAACSDPDNYDYGYIFDDIENGFTTTTGDTIEKRYYDVIVRSDCSGEVYESAKELCNGIEAATGAKACLYYEYEMPKLAPYHSFVYIGALDNSLCRRNYEGYRSDDYGYAVSEGTVLIGGVNDGATMLAIDRFVDKVLSKASAESLMKEEDNYLFVGDYSVKDGLSLNGYPLSEYNIVYLDGDALAMSLANDLRSDIEEYFGYSLSVSSENNVESRARSICIGRTLRADTLGYFCSDVEATLVPYSTGVSVISDSVFGMRLGISRLYELLCNSEANEAEIDSEITVAYEICGIELPCYSFLKSTLSVDEILSVCNEVRATEADLVRIVGLSEKAFDYVARNLAREYESFSVSGQNGDIAFYLYKSDELTLERKSLSVGASCMEVLGFTLNSNGSSFELCELFAVDEAGLLGEKITDEGIERFLIFGRFYGDEEDELMASFPSIERLHHAKLDLDVYANSTCVTLKDICAYDATASKVTNLIIDVYDDL